MAIPRKTASVMRKAAVAVAGSARKRLTAAPASAAAMHSAAMVLAARHALTVRVVHPAANRCLAAIAVPNRPSVAVVAIPVAAVQGLQLVVVVHVPVVVVHVPVVAVAVPVVVVPAADVVKGERT